jgi:hypothetical protein
MAYFRWLKPEKKNGGCPPMNQFINAKETIVTDAIDGLLATSGGALTRLDGYPEWPWSQAAGRGTSPRMRHWSAPAC